MSEKKSQNRSSSGKVRIPSAAARGTDRIVNARTRRPVVVALIVIGLVFAGIACSSQSDEHRIIIVAIDGMDYRLTRSMIEVGVMPNLAALAKEGGFRTMGTSIPPESPVAWSNFITGQNPGGHGIFDFLHPKWETDKKTGEHRLVPVDPVVYTEPVDLSLELFGYDFPLAGGAQFNLRRGTAFWEILEDHGVPATIFKIPAHYPPTATDQQTFSGMGTPDVKGGYGTYTLYTDNEFAIPGHVTSKGQLVTNTIYDNVFRDYLYGPVNTLIAVDEEAGEEPPVTKVPFRVYIDPENPIAKIEIGEEDDDEAKVLILSQGEWSDYISVDFEIIPHLVSVSGIVRFNLQEARPNFRLFVDPINIDPAAPASDVSTPSGWAQELAASYGTFETKGMPENTGALKDGVITYDEYRDHSMLIYDKRKEMLFDLLEEQDGGVLFYYFCSIDLDCHMFWRLMDVNHPSHDPKASDINKNFIEWLYRDVDQVVGEIRTKLRKDDTLIVMSDHGFSPYYRTVNLNTWLLDHGYIQLKEEFAHADREGLDFSAVDWKRTQAYNVGFGSIYLNVAGRDPVGCVDPAEVNNVIDAICSQLVKEKDPKTDRPVFLKMYKTREVYQGEAVTSAPNIVVGLLREYGVSDESALGEFSNEVIADNMSPWSGSHLMAAEEVPGIVFSNRRIPLENPMLYDLTVTLLSEYGIEKGDQMIGQPMWRAPSNTSE